MPPTVLEVLPLDLDAEAVVAAAVPVTAADAAAGVVRKALSSRDASGIVSRRRLYDLASPTVTRTRPAVRRMRRW